MNVCDSGIGRLLSDIDASCVFEMEVEHISKTEPFLPDDLAYTTQGISQYHDDDILVLTVAGLRYAVPSDKQSDTDAPGTSKAHPHKSNSGHTAQS